MESSNPDQNPGTPGSGAEDVPGSGSASEQPSQEELRARLEEQLRNLRVQDLIVESVVSVLNLTARRIAKEDERDLEQGRIGIEAVRAWVDLMPDEAANQIRQALSELQLLYAQAAEGGEGAGQTGAEQGGQNPDAPGRAAEEASGSGSMPGGSSEPGSGPAAQPQQPKRGGEPPPRLWTPGSS